MKRAYLAAAALGVFAIAGAAGWASGGLLDERAVRGPVASPAAGARTGDDHRGFVRATVAGREVCARWSAESAARPVEDGLAITLDCDAMDLELVDLDTLGDACGKLVAQDRIEPIASCTAAGTITPTERGNVRWALGSCACGDIAVSFEVPLR